MLDHIEQTQLENWHRHSSPFVPRLAQLSLESFESSQMHVSAKQYKKTYHGINPSMWYVKSSIREPADLCGKYVKLNSANCSP